MRITRLVAAFSVLTLLLCDSYGQEVVDQWRYALRRPSDGWQAPDFDDSGWKEGAGGFGTHDTPGARVATTWATNNIWLRKSFELKDVPTRPALFIHHDENVHVFINGQRVTSLDGYTTDYQVVEIPADKRDSIKAGRNLMAVHCRQTVGGQFIDVHLIDADNPPTLPTPKRSTKPFISDLITEWGEAVTPENAWTEYPRPQLRRDNWTNLNGEWDYAVTSIEQKEPPSEWSGQILVPFCLESKLGGVQRLLDSTEALWYRRSFASHTHNDRRLLLHFETVDYRCEAFVNGQSVGKHVGGNTPFSFDITEAVRSGENELIVRVEDATEEYQLCGKQVINARGIWYTQVSGIWQTVWLEVAPRTYVQALKLETDASTGRVSIKPTIVGGEDAATIEVLIRDGDAPAAEHVRGAVANDQQPLVISIGEPKLWSPVSPHLYQVDVSLLDADGSVIDRVESYVGIRSVGKTQDADGHWRFTLNGEVLFHWGPLDQGWWPDGLLTPPSDKAMQFDIEWLKAAGFNMIRKHIKVGRDGTTTTATDSA